MLALSRVAARAFGTVVASGPVPLSFGRQLFMGNLETAAVFPYPEPLSVEAKEMLAEMCGPVDKFFKETNDASKNDETASVPAEISAALGEMGAFGLQVSPELGGVGLSATGYARMVEIVGAADLGVGIYLGAHQSIGFKGITLFGTPAQKEKYLPPLAAGKQIAAFALTEPSSGSDANSIKSRAVLDKDGKHFILNGGKIWISNGGICEVLTVFAQTPVPDGKGGVVDKVTAFIVERAFGGVTNGPPEKKMGIKCSNTAEVFFDNVKIPVENVLGEVGAGFKVAMAILNNGRFGMGAALTGTMKGCIKGAIDHAVNRTQFNDKLRNFQAIQGKFADMEVTMFAAESLAYMVAGSMDAGSNDYQIEAAISKVFASEAAWRVVDECIQVLGGLGFMRAYPYERVLRDLRIFRIFEGTNDILRLFIALTGVQGVGAHLKTVQAAAASPFSNSTLLLTQGLPVLRRQFNIPVVPQAAWVTPELAEARAQLEHGTAAFGTAVQAAVLKHKKGITSEQLLLERIANVSIDLYTMAAVLSRTTKSVSARVPTAAHETALAAVFCSQASLRINDNINAMGSSARSLDAKRVAIAKALFDAGDYIPKHPLGF